ncbi:hypothetical protein EMPG_10436 [Blastomyces silverae]|uniref:Aminoglycoside phosphotransferase domain-containing protein n=1 Tax=Blastomyces silverae TaxID=2060906 RepID=A0A0H1B562_9EURO|nr:hypothetical protein EMPG_10436 [Blastomyces silverae]
MGKIITQWIGDLFDGLRIACTDGTSWDFEDKISERSSVNSSLCLKSKIPEADAQAVYNARQFQGASVGSEAIIKVRMQIPPKEGVHPAQCATRQPSSTTVEEILRLEYFNEKGCSVTPRLLHKEKIIQGPNLPTPGGYIVFIVMEKVPGVPLTDFWTYDRPKRDRIREAFQKGMTEIRSFGGYSIDMGLQNLIYDEKRGKCYFVDYEGFRVDMNQAKFGLDQNDYHFWGLAYDQDGEEVL